MQNLIHRSHDLKDINKQDFHYDIFEKLRNYELASDVLKSGKDLFILLKCQSKNNMKYFKLFAKLETYLSHLQNNSTI